MEIGGYKLIDPDRIGQSEYRFLYDLLEEVMPTLGEEDAAEHAVAILEEVKDWCDDLITSLKSAAAREVSNGQ